MTALSVYPTALKLKGMDDAPQLIVTGKRADGREVDLSGTATYSVSDAAVVRVDQTGRVFPLANGTAEVTITVSSMNLTVPIVAEKMEAPLPINFATRLLGMSLPT